MMATRKGLVKKTPIQDYANVRNWSGSYFSER